MAFSSPSQSGLQLLLQSPCGHSSALNSTKLPEVDFISLFRRFQLFLEVQGFMLISLIIYKYLDKLTETVTLSSELT